MTSVTLPRRAHNLHLIREHGTYNTDDDEESNSIIENNYSNLYNWSKINKPNIDLSYDVPEIQSSSTTNNNRLKHLCSSFKRRFTLTKEHRRGNENLNRSVSERRTKRFNNYKSFSSSDDNSLNEYAWPD